jgi:hypothetical protein
VGLPPPERRVQKLDSSCKLTDSAGRAESAHPTGQAVLHGFTATLAVFVDPRRGRDRSRLALAPEGRAPNGAGQVPAGEPEPPELVVWHEFLDQRKELSLLKPDVCVKQLPRRIQRLSIDDAGRHGDSEFASEPLELHVLDACLAEGSRLRRDVPEEKREEFFFLIAKVDTLFVPEELHEFPGRREPSRSISLRGSTAQPRCLHQSVVMVARERD